MKLTAIALAAIVLLVGCTDSTAPTRVSQSVTPKTQSAISKTLSSTQITREVIDQLKLWVRVFRGEEIPSYAQSFPGRINLDGADVLIFDASATGTLTYAYPVPIESSIIVITPTGGLVIRHSPRTVPARYLRAIPSITTALRNINSTRGLQRRSAEGLGEWYARILMAIVGAMERNLKNPHLGSGLSLSSPVTTSSALNPRPV